MEDNLLHSENALSPMFVTLSGIVMESNFPQVLNELFPILVTLSGILISVNPTRP